MDKIAKALVAVQSEITNAPKESKNPFFNSTYTDLATAVNHCRPVLAKHGLAIYQTFDGTFDAPIIVTTLLHESGEQIQGRLQMKPVKADPQSLGALLTYGRRYSYLAIVGIAPEDDDAQSAMPAKTKAAKEPEQPKPPTDPNAWTDGQRKMLFGFCKKAALSEAEMKAFVEKYIPGKTKKEASDLLDHWDEVLADFTKDKDQFLEFTK